VPAQASFSEWSGNYGINFEVRQLAPHLSSNVKHLSRLGYQTASVSRLNETGRADDDGSDTTAINIIGMGTEQVNHCTCYRYLSLVPF
jgi:beta-fructofuranosidase